MNLKDGLSKKEKQDNKTKSEEKFFKMHKDDSDRLFEENSAPIGWGYVISSNVCIFRRLIWLAVMFFGTCYSAYNIMENAMTYYKYPTFVEKLVANEETARFPQITMCPNALHALSKINTQFPKLNLTLLEELYSGNTSFFEEYEKMSLEKMLNLEKMNPEDSSYDSIRDEAIALNESIALMKKIDYEKFLEETKATMMVTGCRSYMAAKEESKCQDDWRETLTRYGRCQVFNPDKNRFTTKITYGRGATMAFSIVYNDSDHTIGWFPFLSGLTLFYSDAYELTIDPLYSVTVPPGDGPLVAFNQVRNELLGEPYSTCIQQDPSILKYYENYTIDHCYHECMVDQLKDECKCVPHYLESRERLRNETTGIRGNQRGPRPRNCTIWEHATCVSRVIQNFNYTECGNAETPCIDPCCATTQEASLIQYGKYKYAKTLSDMSGKPVDQIQSGVIYLAETRESQEMFSSSTLSYHTISAREQFLYENPSKRKETPKYSGESLFSDIGGHAGLVLGISFTTVLGIVDYIASKCWFVFYHRIIKNMSICRNR